MKVWVNGTFDVLHIGHIRLLEYANTFGDVRVGLDTDERISILKGHNRPFNCLPFRVEFLNSIKYVNDVVIFDTDEELIKRIKDYSPDIMVIGSDYKNKPIIGSEYVKKIVYFERIEDLSTTNILTYGKNIGDRV